MQYSLIFFTLPLCLFALNGKPDVVKGSADYSLVDSTEVLRVTDKTILEYKGFNIEQHETTRYEQPSSKSTLLCRVSGKDITNVRGRLEANGKLLLINPNGIIFSKTSYVNVGTLIASTLSIKDEDFLSDRFKFKMDPAAEDAYIINAGRIEAAHNVAFMAPYIVNHGVISAKVGKISFMGAEVMTLDFDGDEKIQFAVEVPLRHGHIEQMGVVIGSEVCLKLPMAQKVIKSVVNDIGVVEANCIVTENGVISLKEGSYTGAKKLQVSADTIQICGELDVPGVCDLSATQQIRWLKGNSVDHLKTESEHLLIAGPVATNVWESHVLQEVILAAPVTVHDSGLAFDAPVILYADDLLLTASKGPITFLSQLESKDLHDKLTLSAPLNDIDFKKGVSIGSLNVLSAQKIHIADAMTAHEGPLTFNGVVHLQGNVNMNALKGEILFNQGVQGAGELYVRAPSVVFKDDVGSIAALLVDAKELIKISNVRAVEGELQLSSKGPIYFEGSHYSAREHHYQTPSFEFPGRQEKTSFVSTTAPIVFHGTSLVLGETTSLEMISQEGSIEIPAVHGENGSHLTIHALKNHLKIGMIDGVGALELSAAPLILESTVDAGSIRLMGEGPVYVSHPITASKGDLIINAPTLFETSEARLEAKGCITQLRELESIDSVEYKAGAIHLGHDVEAKNSIHFKGPVTLVNQDAIHLIANKAGSGEIIFESTLDSDTASRSLVIQNAHTPISRISFRGDVVKAAMKFNGAETYIETPGSIRFEGPLDGNTALTLRSLDGDMTFAGSLGDRERFKAINLIGKRVTQLGKVVSTGPVYFGAEAISLGHDIQTKNTIIFDAPVTLVDRDAIHLTANMFGTGEIIFQSTLDADKPSRILTIQNGKSRTQIKGDIGSCGPLGALTIDSDRISLGGEVVKAALTLRSPEGEINLTRPIKSAKSITLEARTITQHEPVFSAGKVHYTAEQIHLGHHITTSGDITLAGRVTLFQNDLISLTANKYGKGDISLHSTLDADGPSRTLTIQNGKSKTEIKGAIGKQGAFDKLEVNSDKISLSGDIGEIKLLNLKASTIDCKGASFHAGEQQWSAERIDFNHEGPVILKTAHLPLKIGRKIHLNNTTAFAVDTQGGDLDLGEIYSSSLQPITIRTGEGNVIVHGIGEMNLPSHVSDLKVEANTIILSGRVEANTVSMNARVDIKNENGEPSIAATDTLTLSAEEGSLLLKGPMTAKKISKVAGQNVENGLTKSESVGLNAQEGSVILLGRIEASNINIEAGKNIENENGITQLDADNQIPTILNKQDIDGKYALKAQEGRVVLNAKGGSVGGIQENQHIVVDTKTITIGSKNTSYLLGNCQNNSTPLFNPLNAPPLVYFNGEKVVIFIPPPFPTSDGSVGQEELLETLSPALLQNIPTAFMDGGAIKPRKASIYYELSSN